MLPSFLLILLTWATAQNPQAQQQPKNNEPAPANAAQDTATTLLRIHRVCVEPFGDDPLSRQLQAMVINALTDSKRFTITEKCDKADAILRGVTTELIHQESHSSSESTAVGGSAARSDSGSSASRSAHVGISDSSHATETLNDVRLAVRLVDDQSGDVVWATTQESSGAKYKGSAADTADKVVKRLIWDIEKAEKARDSEKKPAAN